MSTTHKIYEDEHTAMTVTEQSSEHYIELYCRHRDSLELSTERLGKSDYLDVVVRLLEALNYSIDPVSEVYITSAIESLNKARLKR